MINILYYGNCQARAIGKILSIPESNITQIECFSTDISEEDFLEVVKKQDFIIMHHIHQNYRSVDHLSSDFIINNKKDTCVVIFIDNCYFTYYYPDMIYLHQYDENGDKKLIQQPYDYHNKFIIDSYLTKKTVDECISCMKSLNQLNDLDKILSQNISELERRHNTLLDQYVRPDIYFVPISQYIAENYNQKLLFYSFNHPTKHLLQYMCEKIVEILKKHNIHNNNIDHNVDPLDLYKGVIFDYIKNNMMCNMDSHIPWIPQMELHCELTHKETDMYLKDMSAVSNHTIEANKVSTQYANDKHLRKIIEYTYETYKRIQLETMKLDVVL